MAVGCPHDLARARKTVGRTSGRRKNSSPRGRLAYYAVMSLLSRVGLKMILMLMEESLEAFIALCAGIGMPGFVVSVPHELVAGEHEAVRPALPSLSL